jgi:hypothetical protein
MFVSVTRVRTAEDEPLESATMVAEELTRWLRDVDGFEGFLMLSREGTSVGLAFWESRHAAERNLAMRKQFRERMLSIAGVEIESTEDYDVTFFDLSRVADVSP